MNIVYVPCKDISQAKLISRNLTKNRLAVCINIINPIISIYRWKGKIEEAQEALIIIKTDDRLAEKVINQIKKLHSYDTPDIISWRIDKTTPEVQKWVLDEL